MALKIVIFLNMYYLNECFNGFQGLVIYFFFRPGNSQVLQYIIL